MIGAKMKNCISFIRYQSHAAHGAVPSGRKF